ncbi:ribosomal protein L22 [Gigaspora margarita]|uniref:Ribosomal protein L22 n=2 Tax=Gigaspora margarita TaxID=4874 RepID=A0A8H4A4R2_GIGMA|nr:ribosomal protein L22 [Gigaspora margarita]
MNATSRSKILPLVTVLIRQNFCQPTLPHNFVSRSLHGTHTNSARWLPSFPKLWPFQRKKKKEKGKIHELRTSQPTYGPSPIFDYEEYEKQEQNKGSIVEHKVINKNDPKYTEAKKKSTEHRYSTMNFRISPRKLRFLANQIAGKPINEAIKQMEFSPKKASKKIMNSLITARDHAWRYKMMDADNVYIDQAFVGKGLYRKKPNYGARGRFSFLKIKKAHMKYVLKVKRPEMDLGIGNKRIAKTFKVKRKVWMPLIENKPIYNPPRFYNW